MKHGSTVRVIAGQLKGRRLKTIDSPGTRPMTDRVRENLFNIIQMHLPGARFLDLFAGSGAVGIEALSRGAARAEFVEKAADWAAVITENLAELDLSDRARLHQSDVFDAIDKLAAEGARFDSIFIGAPYDLDLHSSACDAVVQANLLAADGLLINQYRKGNDFETPTGFMARHRDYGITRLSFLRREKS